MPLCDRDWYAENRIALKLKTDVIALDPRAKELTLGDSKQMKFNKLLRPGWNR